MGEDEILREASGETERTLSFGENLVGLNFNPSQDGDVNTVKTAFAAIIDLVDRVPDGNPVRTLLKDLAFTSCIAAQMAVVKFITWEK